MGNSNNSKILLLGLDNSGKTTLFHWIKSNDFVNTSPTTHFKLETIQPKKFHGSLKRSNITLLDLCGSKPNIWGTYANNVNILLYVIDATDMDRLEESKSELFKLLSTVPDKFPVIVVLNKFDKKGCKSPEYLLNKLDLLNIDNKRQWVIRCVCLMTGEGLPELYESIHSILKGDTKSNFQFNTLMYNSAY